MLDSSRIKAAIRDHCQFLSAHDKDAWLSLWAEDAILEDPVGVDTYPGKETLSTTFWRLIEDLFPMKIWLERDVIVCRNEAIGQISGVVTKGGKLVRVGPIVDHFTFNDAGEIVSMRAFWTYQ